MNKSSHGLLEGLLSLQLTTVAAVVCQALRWPWETEAIKMNTKDECQGLVTWPPEGVQLAAGLCGCVQSEASLARLAVSPSPLLYSLAIHRSLPRRGTEAIGLFCAICTRGLH